MVRALALTIAAVAGFAAVAPAATTTSVQLSTSQPGNASIATMTVKVKTSGLTDQQRAALKPRLKLTTRNRGVVVLYAYRRLGTSSKFRVVIVGLRGKTESASAAVEKMAKMNMEFLAFKAKPPDFTVSGFTSARNVISLPAHQRIVAAAIDAGFSISDDFTVKRAGGALQDGAPSPRTFVTNIFHEATGDTSYAGRDQFLQRMESCCVDE
jgi:hypothetical protein